jgi:predicted nucleic acid-binding protein
VTRSYICSGVLIAAARGAGTLGSKALDVIGDTQSREFVCSDYVRLEVLPKPTYFKRPEELAFYAEFFSRVSVWVSFSKEHLDDAMAEACASGLSSMDAVHVAVAASNGCDEIITTEKPTSAIHRTKLVPIVSIYTE